MLTNLIMFPPSPHPRQRANQNIDPAMHNFFCYMSCKISIKGLCEIVQRKLNKFTNSLRTSKFNVLGGDISTYVFPYLLFFLSCTHILNVKKYDNKWIKFKWPFKYRRIIFWPFPERNHHHHSFKKSPNNPLFKVQITIQRRDDGGDGGYLD